MQTKDMGQGNKRVDLHWYYTSISSLFDVMDIMEDGGELRNVGEYYYYNIQSLKRVYAT